MPLDVLGCTRATMVALESSHAREGAAGRDVKWRSWESSRSSHAWDRLLKLLALNEEFLVSASHHLALNTSLLFVHTARRCTRLDDLVNMLEWSVLLIKKD